MAYNNEEEVKKQIICLGILKPIQCFEEATRRVGIMRIAFYEAGAKEEHKRVLDGLHQRTAQAVNVLIDAYNGLVSGIDNLSVTEVTRAIDSSRERLGELRTIDREIDSFCQVAGQYNFKRNPILQIMGSDSLYHSTDLESFANN